MNINEQNKFQIPTVMVLLGITGDLVRKKILHALFSLYTKGMLPDMFHVYGFARRDYTDDSIREYLRHIMVEKKFDHEDRWEEFLNMFHYVQGTFNDDSAYANLAERIGLVEDTWSYCSNKLFYLAVPPKHYETIVQNLSLSHLTKPCSEKEGFTRVILEKPFGSDYHTAFELDRLLGELLKEEQIYRVDHYLGKETVRNILAFRFGNSFFAPNWSHKHIECIEVNMFEKIDVQDRVEFYDAIGAFRDFGKNHMMQLFALFSMEAPASLHADEIRRRRADVFECLCCLTQEESVQKSRRGQYKGYRDQEGVADDSDTETYFEVATTMEAGLLKGVPVHFRHGKALESNIKEIKITFKRSASMDLFGKREDLIDDRLYQNVLHYHIHPDESIKMRFYVKQPGHVDVLDRQNFGFSYDETYGRGAGIEAYEQLLMDIIEGDQTLFVSTDEILKQWQFVEPLLKAWEGGKPELFMYEKGTMPEFLE